MNRKGSTEIGDPNLKKTIDCLSFVSAVAYASGVNYEIEKAHGFGLNGKGTHQMGIN